MPRVSLLLVLLCLFALPEAAAQPQHGAPIRALAVLADGSLVSAGLDAAMLRWPAGGGAAELLRFHQGAVQALVALPGGGFASGGEDGRIAIWPPGANAPARVLIADGPVTALAAAQGRIAAALQDGTARAWGEDGTTGALGDRPAGALLLRPGGFVTGGSDGMLANETGATAATPAPIAALAASGDLIAAAGADGVLRLFNPDLTLRAELEAAASPLVGIAAQGGRIAVAAIAGTAVIVEAASARILAVINTGEAAVWAVGFAPDGTLITGGTGRTLRRWDPATGRLLATFGPAPPAPAPSGDRGAQVFRACAVCHALTPDDTARAGPSLHRLFGRKVGGLADYAYSPALRDRGGVWSPELLGALFAEGPQAFAPGTTMPEQRLADPADRAALADFLARAAR